MLPPGTSRLVKQCLRACAAHALRARSTGLKRTADRPTWRALARQPPRLGARRPTACPAQASLAPPCRIAHVCTHLAPSFRPCPRLAEHLPVQWLCHHRDGRQELCRHCCRSPVRCSRASRASRARLGRAPQTLPPDTARTARIPARAAQPRHPQHDKGVRLQEGLPGERQHPRGLLGAGDRPADAGTSAANAVQHVQAARGARNLRRRLRQPRRVDAVREAVRARAAPPSDAGSCVRLPLGSAGSRAHVFGALPPRAGSGTTSSSPSSRACARTARRT